MTDLSDSARVVLAAAAQRDDLSVLPFPEGCRAKGGAEERVLSSLKKRGLIQVIGSEGGPERLIITSEGMAAIGLDTEDKVPGGVSKKDASPTSAEAGVQALEVLAQAALASTKVPSNNVSSEAKAEAHGCAAPGRGHRGLAGRRAAVSPGSLDRIRCHLGQLAPHALEGHR
jgi:hypothetical protein